MVRTWTRIVLSCLVLGIIGLPLRAETCLSPFVKRLNRPEKYLYVFCVDADAKDHDFLAVVDVDPASASYGTVTYQLDLGSAGNETHHFGFTDDRTRIFGCSLFSSRIFLIDVATNPAQPKLEKVLEPPEKLAFAGPHSPYALPGRMLLSFLSGRDGGLPAGLAEFTNDGKLIREIALPKDAPYMYDVAIKPDLNRMVTSSFTPLSNYRKPMAKMDLKNFGKELLLWDFRERKVLAKLTTGGAPLECRWSLKEKANHGFTNCALDNSIWVWEGDGDKYTARKLCDTGKLPADLRQSPDDRFLFVSCFLSDEIQQWDVSDLKKPRLAGTVKPGKQPNMMHVTGDGKRMYVTNSLLSTMDPSSDDFWVRLVRIGPDGLKLDEKFKVDLTKFKTGPARGHDMLLN